MRMLVWRRVNAAVFVCALVVSTRVSAVSAQGLGGAGTIQGIVTDPTGGVMQAVEVKISNPVSGFTRTTTTDTTGKYVFRNLPPNPYHLSVAAQGFQTLERDITVRSSVPLNVDLPLALATATTTVTVVGTSALVETNPTAHTDIDQSLVAKLPIESSSGLNQVITLASPGVVADSNGFFHPVGDHAQTQFSIDNQPVTDQQSRVYSNQISPDAVQSLEVITGVPQAEFGDKDSLVVRIVTKSGLDSAAPTGTASFTYGSFKSPGTEATLGMGSHRFGNFLSVGGTRTDRFLDPPEFAALHDNGSSQSLFDRLDARPNDMDAFHLNVQIGRSSFNVPNTYDQNTVGQAQHQTIDSFNAAPGYTRILSPHWLLTANGFARRDHVVYTPSPNALSDLPVTVSQDRKLTNVGGKVDLAYSQGMHDLKLGGAINATRLNENFSLGITNPTDPAFAGLDIAPFDLTHGGTPFQFSGDLTVKTQAAYIQDTVKTKDVTVNLGLRVDHYDGTVTASKVEPRLGIAYTPPGTGTVLRVSYGRTMETPYNENLIVSSATGNAGLTALGAGNGMPLAPGTRDQYEVGIEQAFGRWIVANVGYFYKKTTNAYDFGVLFDTPIAFPIMWDHSKLDGVTARINLVQHGGFSAFTVLGHTNALFSFPQTGGIFPDDTPSGTFRIDHDQKFQQTTNLQYELPSPQHVWLGFTWRYDSGLVAGSVASLADALALSGDQQAAIGFFCGNTVATVSAPITNCSSNFGATRLRIPAEGTENDETNPPRIAPRHLFDLAVGADNVLNTSKTKLKIRFSVINLTNKEALYNFLSTFSGTHFVTPRAYQVQVGVTF